MREYLSATQRRIRWYEIVDSTNDVARVWAQADAPEGAVVCSDSQSAGRGRRGSAWVCPPAEGLAFSLILRPTMPRALWSRLALMTGLAVARCLERYGMSAEVKWPNDVLVAGKKICGILVEAAGDSVIVGVGINVNVRSFPAELEGIATSMFLETGIEQDRALWLEQLVESIVQHAGQVEYDFPLLIDALRLRCALTGKNVSLIRGGQLVYGVVRGMNEQGELLFECDGTVQSVLQADQIRVIG